MQGVQKKMKIIPLVNLASGKTGIIKDIVGGRGVKNRLYSLGIISGKKIMKISAMIMHGPVVVRVGSTQIALGFGMASKILVEQK